MAFFYRKLKIEKNFCIKKPKTSSADYMREGLSKIETGTGLSDGRRSNVNTLKTAEEIFQFFCKIIQIYMFKIGDKKMATIISSRFNAFDNSA